MFTAEEFKKYHAVGMEYESSICNSNIYPHTYLEYAIEDIHQVSERTLINALSNCKRSLHFQIDLIVDVLGYNSIKSHKSSFPSKLEFCKKCGVITPRILEKINKVRNIVEHEYFIPNFEQVQDFIDIVQLFISATDKYINELPSGLEFDLYDEDNFGNIQIGNALAQFERSKGKLNIKVKRIICDKEKIYKDAELEKEKLLRLNTRLEEGGSQEKYDVENHSLKQAIHKNLTEDSICITSEFENYTEWISIYLEHSYN